MPFVAIAFAKIFDTLDATTLSFGRTQLSLLDLFQLALSALAIFVLTHYLNRVLRSIVLRRFIYEQGIRYIVEIGRAHV